MTLRAAVLVLLCAAPAALAQCAGGSFAVSDDSPNTCIPCPPGRFVGGWNTLNECVECPPQTYTESRGALSCVPCFEGFVSEVEGYAPCGRAGRNPGGGTPPPACPGGQVTRYSSDRNVVECVLCGKGEYRPAGDDTDSCSACPTGTYQEERGHTSCSACPTGTYSDAGRASCSTSLHVVLPSGASRSPASPPSPPAAAASPSSPPSPPAGRPWIPANEVASGGSSTRAGSTSLVVLLAGLCVVVSVNSLVPPRG